MSASQPQPSPRTPVRTPENPLAFRFGEVLYGTFIAVLCYLVLCVATILLLGILDSGNLMLLNYTVTLHVLNSAITAYLLSPVTWAISLLLQKQRKNAAHLLSYALLSIPAMVVGSLMTSLFFGSLSLGLLTIVITTPLGILYFLPAVIALPLGWLLTKKLVLARDSSD